MDTPKNWQAYETTAVMKRWQQEWNVRGKGQIPPVIYNQGWNTVYACIVTLYLPEDEAERTK